MTANQFYYDFAKFYVPFSLVVCLVGTVANVLMAVVLTRAVMSSTVNRLMAYAALLDACIMASYFVYAAHFRIDVRACPIYASTYGWTVYEAAYADFTVFARATSLWLSAAIAFYRKRALTFTPMIGGGNGEYERNTRARYTLGIVSVNVLVLAVPIFLMNRVTEDDETVPEGHPCHRNGTVFYVLRPYDFMFAYNELMLKVSYCINAIALKLAPCTFLAYNLLFIVVLTYRHRRKVVRSNRNRGSGAAQKSSCRCTVSAPWSILLCVILCATFLCEAPNAVLSAWCAVANDETSRKLYVNLGDVLDCLSLVQCISTSFLYCVLSKRFRLAAIRCCLDACAWADGDLSEGGAWKDDWSKSKVKRKFGSKYMMNRHSDALELFLRCEKRNYFDTTQRMVHSNTFPL